MPVGPRGEKRPVSSVSSMNMAMRVAVGIAEEQYVDGRPWTDEEVMARRIASGQSKADKKKRKKREK